MLPLECFPLEIVFLPAFQQFECFPLQVVFYTSISAVGMLPPWNCFLPTFPQIERFPLKLFLPAFQQLDFFPFKLYRYVQKRVCKYNIMYIYIYIYNPDGIHRIQNRWFRPQKHLPESVKKPIRRITTSSGIGKKQHIHSLFPAIHFDPGKYFFQVFGRSMDCCSRLWFKPVPQRDNCDFSMESVLQRVLQGQSRGELWKKTIFCNENKWNWVVFLKKMMNIFTGDLNSM